MKTFDLELQDLINKHDIDAKCGVPDYVLAAFVVQSLEPLKIMLKDRDERLDAPSAPKVLKPNFCGMTQQDLFVDDVNAHKNLVG